MLPIHAEVAIVVSRYLQIESICPTFIFYCIIIPTRLGLIITVFIPLRYIMCSRGSMPSLSWSHQIEMTLTHTTRNDVAIGG